MKVWPPRRIAASSGSSEQMQVPSQTVQPVISRAESRCYAVIQLQREAVWKSSRSFRGIAHIKCGLLGCVRIAGMCFAWKTDVSTPYQWNMEL